MNRILKISALVLWTAAVAGGAAYWARGRAPWSPSAKEPEAIDTGVGDWAGSKDESWMVTQWGMSHGPAIHAKREVMSEGLVRVTVDNANGFSWDTVIIDLAGNLHGRVQATATMTWRRDSGPPFEGSVDRLTGSVWIGSANLSDAHPLVIEYHLRGQGEDAFTCEHGLVSVP